MQPDIGDAWRDYRRRRIAFLALFIGYVPATLAFGHVVGRPLSALTGIDDVHLGIAAAVCWMAPFSVAAFRMGWFPCPRCGKPFFQTSWIRNPFARKCMHCGLPKWTDAERRADQPAGLRS